MMVADASRADVREMRAVALDRAVAARVSVRARRGRSLVVMNGVYEQKTASADGKTIDFGAFKGRVVYAVNVASR